MLASFLKSGEKAELRASRGNLVARLLGGAWKGSPPPPYISSQELEEISLLLLRSGAGGLAWSRVRNSDLRTSPAAREFQQAYRLHSLQAALHNRNLKRVIPVLRSFGVEPILVKGWAIARRYPEPGMRPYGDFDLCVLPDQYAAAKEALKLPECLEGNVDLHLGFGKFYDRQAEDIFARSQLVRLDELEVRVLSDEDHLRFLCLHLLRHGAVRPLWLCDIAMMLETLTDDFDWDICLSGSRRQADWVACTIGLAHLLLGARIEGMPISGRAQNLPSWFAPTALKEWGVPFRIPAPILIYLRHPLRQFMELLEEMPCHWPNPIEATMTLKGSFNELPRLPFQVGHIFSRAAALVSQLPGMYLGSGTS